MVCFLSASSLLPLPAAWPGLCSLSPAVTAAAVTAACAVLPRTARCCAACPCCCCLLCLSGTRCLASAPCLPSCLLARCWCCCCGLSSLMPFSEPVKQLAPFKGKVPGVWPMTWRTNFISKTYLHLSLGNCCLFANLGLSLRKELASWHSIE